MASKHDEVARRIAQQHGTDYNRGPGADVRADHATVEVESDRTIADAGRQLQGHKGPVYVAGTNDRAVQKALERYGESTVGVMDAHGNIVKPSTRK